MRQFIESVLFYQVVTCRFSPVEKYIKYKPELPPEQKQKKFAMYVALFFILFVYQLVSLLWFKQQNMYELLQLKNQFVTTEQI